jgi:catalase
MKDMKKDGKRAELDENSKDMDLEKHRENTDEQYLTTNQGVRVTHTDDSLRAGQRGPTIMEDFHFREKMTHFDHERIPERVVHARGSGAHGYFQVYKPMTEYTKAGFLQDPSVKTPVFVRFSTVVGFRGSADTVRDVRGFATKFYTEDGNYDLVGNNMPVFFIQDAIKFPDLVHAIKPEPHHEMPQASAAHDNFWDFISLMPESMHMIMWVLSDRALPRSYSMQEGFGVHTFRFVNAEGKSRFVKFHWKPTNGIHSLVWDETQKIAGKDPDFNRKDLWESIEMGNFPEFELCVQMIEEDEEFAFNFDILDPTKIWPEELVPVMPIGKMVLNRNPDNFFAETEQVAFHPGHVVPGIDFTNDPLLQGRLFSYLDTQLIRLGGPNFAEIPINRPLVAVHNNQQDGFMRQTILRRRTNYHPNSLSNGDAPVPAPPEKSGYHHYMEKVEGVKIRERSESFMDHFTQATFFWNSMTDIEKQHIIEAAQFELGKVKTKEVRQRVVDLFTNIDLELARQVAEGVGVKAPSYPTIVSEIKGTVTMKTRDGQTRSLDHSPALSQEDTAKNSIKGRKIAVLVAEGFNSDQVMQLKSAMEAEGATVQTVSKHQKMLDTVQGDLVEVDMSFLTTQSVLFDAVFIPGGAHIEKLRMMGDAVNFVQEAFKHCKPVGAMGEGVEFLRGTDIQGVRLHESRSQDPVMVDRGVVTTTNGSGDGFADAFFQAIAQHRHWNREMKEQVPA